MTVFGQYAKYYDQLYADKDYEREAKYVAGLAKRHMSAPATLLDLGCGTGRHAIHFVRQGFAVTGVERSSEMLAAAAARIEDLTEAQLDSLRFVQGDVRSVRLGQTFDVTVALFHVLSYQATNEDLADTFETARRHMRKGGAFIFDCWYGPGVLSDPPQVRVRRIPRPSKAEFIRITEPALKHLDSHVEVKFTVFAPRNQEGRLDVVEETHVMRYLFKPEVDLYAKQHGFKIVACRRWLSHQPPDASTWNACFVAKAI